MVSRDTCVRSRFTIGHEHKAHDCTQAIGACHRKGNPARELCKVVSGCLSKRKCTRPKMKQLVAPVPPTCNGAERTHSAMVARRVLPRGYCRVSAGIQQGRRLHAELRGDMFEHACEATHDMLGWGRHRSGVPLPHPATARTVTSVLIFILEPS